MTEYDYSPHAYDRYMANQHRVARWAESTHSFPPSDAFMGRTPSRGHRPRMEEEMRGGRSHHSSHSRGRSPYPNPVPLEHQNRGSMPNIQIESPIPMRPGSSDMNTLHGVSMPPIHNSVHSMSSRPASRAQSLIPMSAQPSLIQEAQPLQEHYSSSTHIPPMGHMGHPSQINLSRAASHHSNSHMPGFTSNPIVPMSSSGYHSYYSRPHTPEHEYSDESYPHRSRSGDSYYRTPSAYYYGDVHPSVTTPTIVQPSRSRPVVVPINGGAGGFVVIPPVGQSVHVVASFMLYSSLNGLTRNLFNRILEIIGIITSLVITRNRSLASYYRQSKLVGEKVKGAIATVLKLAIGQAIGQVIDPGLGLGPGGTAIKKGLLYAILYMLYDDMIQIF